MSRDAEDFDLNLTQRPGNPVKEGFQDKDGSYPKRDYNKSSDVNNNASFASDIRKTTVGTRTAKRKSDQAQTAAKLVSEPLQSSRSTYPKNQTIETKSGHLIEYDDTPGNERLNFRHRTGAKVELLPDGSLFLKSENKSYSITASDSEVVVRGQALVIIESNADIRVQGDATLQVDGDYNQVVQGDYRLEVQGDKVERVHGNATDSVTGGRLEETRGNTIKRHLSNYRERTVGDHSSEYGGDWNLTAEGAIHQRSYGAFDGSYFGGLITMNGQNRDGTDGEGVLAAHQIFMTNLHGDRVFLDGDIDAKGSIKIDGNFDAKGSLKIDGGADVGGTIKASSVHAPTFEGTAKKAEFADTAKTAPTGPSIPKIPVPQSPSSASDSEDRADEPVSLEEVIDVVETSDVFILGLDRKPESKFNSRILNTGEVVARSRNDWLRNDSEWVSDQVNQGSILDSISSSNPPNTIREGGETDIAFGQTALSQTDLAPYRIARSNRLNVNEIPEHMKLTKLAKSSMLSPNFRLSHMLAGDGLASNICDQAGLSKKDLFDNMQALAYNILEPLRDKYNDTWTISEGLYCPFEEEKIGSGSVTKQMVQGLGVGIQFPTFPNSHYFEAAQWIRNHLTFDGLVLSYYDYDPSGINEPTILITISRDTNAREVSTEFNHVKIDDNILDLADD